jgi:DNA-binding Lrp family transcriptional regulator
MNALRALDGPGDDVELYGEGPRAVDGVDLLALDLPPLRWIVPDLIPEGTTILASPPKVGKSCFVYQIAAEVAIGGALLGRPIEAGSVLYLALEDGQRRGQARLRAALDGRTLTRGRLDVQWSGRRIGDGLEDDLAQWLDDHPDARLVAIDTLQKVRPASNGKRGAYEVDVDDLGRLQSLFRDRAVGLLIVHHSRKEAGDDFLASVSGTYGITGSADTIAVIRRKRLEAFGTILVTGRDVPDAELSVRFDGMTWHEAPAAIAEASFERAEVYSVIEKQGPIFPAAIAEILGLGRTSVQNMVTKLVDRGIVARTLTGYTIASLISLPDDSDDCDSDDSRADQSRESSESSGTRAPARERIALSIEDDYPSSAWADDPAPALAKGGETSP